MCGSSMPQACEASCSARKAHGTRCILLFRNEADWRGQSGAGDCTPGGQQMHGMGRSEGIVRSAHDLVTQIFLWGQPDTGDCTPGGQQTRGMGRSEGIVRSAHDLMTQIFLRRQYSREPQTRVEGHTQRGCTACALRELSKRGARLMLPQGVQQGEHETCTPRKILYAKILMAYMRRGT